MRLLPRILLSALLVASVGSPQRQLLLTSAVVAGGTSSINSTPVQAIAAVRNPGTIAFSSNVTAGNLATLEVGNEDTGNAPTAVSGTAACPTWTHIATVTQASKKIDLWYSANLPGGACTITVTITGDNFQAAQELSGASTSAPLDTFAVANGDVATLTPSLTTALSNELLLVAVNTSSGAATPCSGYTLQTNNAFTLEVGVYRKAAGAAGSYNATVCAGGFGAMILAAFK